MKRFLVICLCFAMAGCASVPSPTTVSETTKKIVQYTKLACGFVPTVATIANILSSGASAPFTVIAQGICDAVTTAPLADGGPRQAKYNGVVIRGSFVK